MTDIDDDFIEQLAIRTFREWLASPAFKTRAQALEVQSATDLGRRYLGARAETSAEWGELRDAWFQVMRWWRLKGWITYTETTHGPRSTGTDDPRIERIAAVMEHRGRRSDGLPYSDATTRWIESMNGTAVKQRFCRITTSFEPLIEFLAAEFSPQIDGATREQIAEQFGLPQKLANSVVASLISSGSHRQNRPRLPDGTRPKQIIRT